MHTYVQGIVVTYYHLGDKLQTKMVVWQDWSINVILR